MISQRTIDEVRDVADVMRVVSAFVTLDKRGWAACPFHEEKSKSFHVVREKGFYKCFGCGASGDSIKFLRENQGMDFEGAVKWLAEEFNVTLEFDKGKVETAEQKEWKDQLFEVNEYALGRYRDFYKKLRDNGQLTTDNGQLIKADDVFSLWLEERGISAETALKWQLGYAPGSSDDGRASGRFLSEGLINKGWYKAAEHLGLLRTRQGNNYDVFKNRIMFPIHDLKGNVIGFGGRDVGSGQLSVVSGQEVAKYINSQESDIYKKERVLYGLYFAQAAIRKAKMAIVVEGYMDVIALEQAGVENVVACCGTAWGDWQAKLLKKYCSHVVLMGDGDGAGMRAQLKAVDVFLKNDFKVEVCPLPEGEDPDSFCKKLSLTAEGAEEVKESFTEEISNI